MLSRARATGTGARRRLGLARLCALASLAAGCGGGAGNAVSGEPTGAHASDGGAVEATADDGGSDEGRADGSSGEPIGDGTALRATVTYPFLLPDPHDKVDYFPTVFAHLLGQPIAWTDISTSLACVTLTNPTSASAGATVRVELTGYSTPLQKLVVVPANSTATSCVSPTPALDSLYALDAPIPGQVHTTVTPTVTSPRSSAPVLDDVHAVTIATAQTVFESKFTGAVAQPLYKYQAVLAMPKDPAVQALLAPIAGRSAWGTFAAGGYGMHVDGEGHPVPRNPVTTAVASGGFQIDPAFFNAGESITLSIDAVNCQSCSGQNVDFFVLDEAQFDLFSRAPGPAIPQALISAPAATAGQQFTITAPAQGQYYMVFFNGAGDASPRTLTYQRTGTAADTPLDALQAVYGQLQALNMTYVNVAFSFFDPSASESVRWPATSLADRAANCMDGSVLIASLLEAVQLEPVIVIVPGHAFVAVRQGPGSPLVWPLETTLLGTAPFVTAVIQGIAQYTNPGIQHLAEIDIKAARVAGLTPIPE
ncbi:MAG TPA: hypothetical protein VH044_14890 [Polyangiaceae bacterium]|jgi:hypothetical protein|nr:hypothetical protein [Polyangiaceae bacterium]